MLPRATALTAAQSTAGSFLRLNSSDVTRIQNPTERGKQGARCCPGVQAGGDREGSAEPVLWSEAGFLVCFSFLLAPSWFHNRALGKSERTWRFQTPRTPSPLLTVVRKRNAHLRLVPTAFTLVSVRKNPPPR